MNLIDSPNFKPMLAATCEKRDAIKFPVLATPKIDGIRCIIKNGVALSRSLKPIPNKFIQTEIGNSDLNGLDGELVIAGSFQAVTSAIMSEDGEPDFRFCVFDVVKEAPYAARMNDLRYRRVMLDGKDHRITWLLPEFIQTSEGLDNYTSVALEVGYEGVMIRQPDGPYKFGRSTEKEGALVKIKPFEDAEAVVIGFEEQMHNGNEAKKNAVGRTERSSHKAGMTGKNTLGALVVRCDKFSEEFRIGTGMSDAMKELIWKNRGFYSGKTVKFKYQKIGSTGERPRIPVFLGFRDARDL